MSEIQDDEAKYWRRRIMVETYIQCTMVWYSLTRFPGGRVEANPATNLNQMKSHQMTSQME